MRTTLIVPDVVANHGRVECLIDLASGNTVDLNRCGRMAYMGRLPGSDIHCYAGWISRRQAILVLEEEWGIAHVEAAGNATLVNGVPAPTTPNSTTLQLGSVIRVVHTSLVVSNHEQEKQGRFLIAAANEREFYCCALLAHGEYQAAAAAIGVKKRTFHDRVKRWAEQGDPLAQQAVYIIDYQTIAEKKRRKSRAVPMGTIAVTWAQLMHKQEQN